MKMAFRSFVRNRRVTLIAIAAVMAMTAFFAVFTNSIRVNQASLDDAYDNLEVRAHITASTVQADPYLEEERYQAIMDSGFVAEHAAMVRFKQRDSSNTLRGVSDPSIDSMLVEALQYTEWQEGYDESALRGDQPVCLAPASSGLELGEQREFFLIDQENTVSLTVVGLYELGYSNSARAYYCSLDWLVDTCHRMEVPVHYNALEMRLGGLRQLDVFKTKMQELGMDSGGAILVINDALLREIVSQLSRQIRLLESALPVLLALVAGIGFGLGFLLLRGRKKEAAVMRSLGMRRMQVAGIFLTETAAQALAGTLAGGLAACVVLGAASFQLKYLLLVLVCFLLGGAAAVWKISGVNVFNIMTERE